MSFFFSSRRRHTRFDCDWSSDVCSSDLSAISTQGVPGVEIAERVGYTVVQISRLRRRFAEQGVAGLHDHPNGRAAGRGRGENSGGAGSFKKKKRYVSPDVGLGCMIAIDT